MSAILAQLGSNVSWNNDDRIGLTAYGSCTRRMDNHMGGLRLGPGGADFDEHVLQLGKTTNVRAALGVEFPKT